MNASEWKAFLATWTREVGLRATENPNTPRVIDRSLGLGFPGASDEEIATAEARLGATLPRSYSEFLKATNGLLQPYDYVAACGGDFWPAADVDWFRTRNADWIAAYDPMGDEFVDELRGTLELSHDGDAAVYLLNPRVTTSSGEWQAWCFASWSPEAERFPSFEAMMRARFQNFRDGIIDGF